MGKTNTRQVIKFLGLTVETTQVELSLPLVRLKKNHAVMSDDERRAGVKQNPGSTGGQEECNISNDSISTFIILAHTDGIN